MLFRSTSCDLASSRYAFLASSSASLSSLISSSMITSPSSATVCDFFGFDFLAGLSFLEGESFLTSFFSDFTGVDSFAFLTSFFAKLTF